MPNKYNDEVLFEVKDRIATITMNRPEKKNAINQTVLAAIIDFLGQAAKDPEAWIIVFKGAGDAFSSGHDLKEERGSGRHLTAGDLYLAIRHTYKPIIASVNGIALGIGAGIALSSDIRIMASSARMGWPQANWGMASTSGPNLLSKRVPINICFELLYTSEFISAEKCLKWQMVNQVVPDAELESAVSDFVALLMTKAPLSLRTMKELTIRGQEMTVEEAMEMTAIAGDKLHASDDGKEGRRAFAEKRKPVWVGH